MSQDEKDENKKVKANDITIELLFCERIEPNDELNVVPV
jgi:hypothetical protein